VTAQLCFAVTVCIAEAYQQMTKKRTALRFCCEYASIAALAMSCPNHSLEIISVRLSWLFVSPPGSEPILSCSNAADLSG